MNIEGASPTAQPTGIDKQEGIVNYFIGNDPNNWHTEIPTFACVQYPNIYPGVYLFYYGNQQQLEYDFAVQPGAMSVALHSTLKAQAVCRWTPMAIS